MDLIDASFWNSQQSNLAKGLATFFFLISSEKVIHLLSWHGSAKQKENARVICLDNGNYNCKFLEYCFTEGILAVFVSAYTQSILSGIWATVGFVCWNMGFEELNQ